MKRHKKPDWEAEDLWMEVFCTRLLVFLEETPGSNKYRQVLLGPEEFKQFSINLGKVEKEGVTLPSGTKGAVVKMELSDDSYDLPDLQQITYGPIS